MSSLSLAVRFFSTRFRVRSLIHLCYLRNPRISWATLVWASLNVSHSPVPSASAVKRLWIATWYWCSTSGIRSLETSNREFGWLVKDCFFQLYTTGGNHWPVICVEFRFSINSTIHDHIPATVPQDMINLLCRFVIIWQPGKSTNVSPTKPRATDTQVGTDAEIQKSPGIVTVSTTTMRTHYGWWVPS